MAGDSTAALPRVGTPEPRSDSQRAGPALALDTLLVSPTAVSQLPVETRTVLIAQGCLIPKSGNPLKLNIVSGTLATRGQTDWAMLCWRDQESYILIFWGGRDTCPPLIQFERDSIPASTVPVGAFHPDRYILVLDTREYGSIGDWPPAPAPQPNDLNHDVLDDGIAQKASVRWYCQAGVWWQLPGGD
jgi:hypothetical protein